MRSMWPSQNRRRINQQDYKKGNEEIDKRRRSYFMNEEMRMYLIREFFYMISANHNGSTIYHGLESILMKDEIPQFMKDNMTEFEILTLLMKFGDKK